MSIKQQDVSEFIATSFAKPTKYKGARIYVRAGVVDRYGNKTDFSIPYDDKKGYDTNHRMAAEAFAEANGMITKNEAIIMSKARYAAHRVFFLVSPSDAARIVGRKRKKA